MEQELAKPNHKRTEWIKEIYSWLDTWIVMMPVFMLIFTVFLRPAFVRGSSMENTLFEGDRLILFSANYSPSRGDITVSSQPNQVTGQFEETVVKRVIGLPGDTIDINYATGEVTINGQTLKEGYIKNPTVNQNPNPVTFPLTVPEGQVFVMGDNRQGSRDSRDQTIGLIDQRYLLGRVVLRVWPPNRLYYFDRL